jgi:hypothetical protein
VVVLGEELTAAKKKGGSEWESTTTTTTTAHTWEGGTRTPKETNKIFCGAKQKLADKRGTNFEIPTIFCAVLGLFCHPAAFVNHHHTMRPFRFN